MIKPGFYWWNPDPNDPDEHWMPVEVWSTRIDENLRVSFIYDNEPHGNSIELLSDLGGEWGERISHV